MNVVVSRYLYERFSSERLLDYASSLFFTYSRCRKYAYPSIEPALRERIYKATKAASFGNDPCRIAVLMGFVMAGSETDEIKRDLLALLEQSKD